MKIPIHPSIMGFTVPTPTASFESRAFILRRLPPYLWALINTRCLSFHMTPGTVAIVVGIFLKFVLGSMLAWLYAAMRSRFGPGSRPVAYTAVFVWILGAIFFPISRRWV